MPIETVYVCDQCGGTPKYRYYTVENQKIGPDSDFASAIHWAPLPKAIFCSMECLGKSLQWWASKYDKEHTD